MYTAREATTRDIPRLVELGKQAVLLGAHTRHGWNTEDFSAFTVALLDGENSTVLVVEGPDGVCGGIGLFLVPLFFNHARTIVQEVFLWVSPATRGAGHPLVQAAEAWAVKRGAHELMIFVNHETPMTDRSMKYLTAAGYRAHESNYARAF